MGYHEDVGAGRGAFKKLESRESSSFSHAGVLNQRFPFQRTIPNQSLQFKVDRPLKLNSGKIDGPNEKLKILSVMFDKLCFQSDIPCIESV